MSIEMTMADLVEVVEEMTGETPSTVQEAVTKLIKFTHDRTLDKVLVALKEQTGKKSGYTKISGFEQWVYKQQRIGGYQDEEFKL